MSSLLDQRTAIGSSQNLFLHFREAATGGRLLSLLPKDNMLESDVISQYTLPEVSQKSYQSTEGTHIVRLHEFSPIGKPKREPVRILSVFNVYIYIYIYIYIYAVYITVNIYTNIYIHIYIYIYII